MKKRQEYQRPPQNEIADLPLFDLHGQFAFSKRASYRAELRSMAHAIATVLTDEGLCNVDLVERMKHAGDEFRIKFGDLTKEGYEFACDSFQRWLANTDRWTTERTAEKLQASLYKQVLKFRSR